MNEASRRWRENPFLVLGLAPQASRMEIERQGQKLLGMAELGLAAALTYETPWGPAPRSVDSIRAALAVLADPNRRLVAERWAVLPPPSPVEEASGLPSKALFGWDGL